MKLLQGGHFQKGFQEPAAMSHIPGGVAKPYFKQDPHQSLWVVGGTIRVQGGWHTDFLRSNVDEWNQRSHLQQITEWGQVPMLIWMEKESGEQDDKSETTQGPALTVKTHQPSRKRINRSFTHHYGWLSQIKGAVGKARCIRVTGVWFHSYKVQNQVAQTRGGSQDGATSSSQVAGWGWLDIGREHGGTPRELEMPILWPGCWSHWCVQIVTFS